MSSNVQAESETTAITRYARITVVAVGYLIVTLIAEGITKNHYWTGFALSTAANIAISIPLVRWWRMQKKQRGSDYNWRRDGLPIFALYFLLRAIVGLLWLMVTWF